jgi:hypothetical protein
MNKSVIHNIFNFLWETLGEPHIMYGGMTGITLAYKQAEDSFYVILTHGDISASLLVTVRKRFHTYFNRPLNYRNNNNYTGKEIEEFERNITNYSAKAWRNHDNRFKAK